MKKAIVVLVLVALAGAAAWWFFLRTASPTESVRYRTAKVERGEVIEGVAASGTVQPVELVQVGTQISGTLQTLSADFNSKVKAGQEIALLDSRRLASQVAQDDAAIAKAKADVLRVTALVAQSKVDIDRANASLAQAKADVDRVTAQAGQTKADVDRVAALLQQAKAELARQRQLAQRQLAPQADVDLAVANEGSLSAQLVSAQASVAGSAAQIAVAKAVVKAAEAGVAAAEATVRQNEAQLAVAEASVRQSEAQREGDVVNLGYATIKSPVDGVVVSRNVEVGQTVAASLSAPTLFVIARDLTKIHVETSVPEADVGRVHEKQPATFTVDAYPDRTFPGTVSQVRIAATTVQNVVTYIVVVDASNPDGLLFPGMTANVQFEVARSEKDSLHVPATALRLQPSADLVVGGLPEMPARGRGRGGRGGGGATGSDGASMADGAAMADGSSMGGGESDGGGAPAAMDGGGSGRSRGGGRARRGFVYVLAPGNFLRAVPVKVGISDGATTVVEPVEPGALAEGMDVVTSIVKQEEAATTNPFSAPRMGGPRGGGR